MGEEGRGLRKCHILDTAVAGSKVLVYDGEIFLQANEASTTAYSYSPGHGSHSATAVLQRLGSSLAPFCSAAKQFCGKRVFIQPTQFLQWEEGICSTHTKKCIRLSKLSSSFHHPSVLKRAPLACLLEVRMAMLVPLAARKEIVAFARVTRSYFIFESS